MSKVSIQLSHPFEFENVEYSVLHMRRCKVKDRRAAMKQWKTAEEMEIGLISNLCEIPPQAIDEMDSSDYNKLAEQLKDFFGLNTPD